MACSANAPAPVDEIRISVAPCYADTASSTRHVGITIHVPDRPQEVPIDICCVIDISGSMGEDAKFQDPHDETKTVSEGMNQLDLVKHAVKTIIRTLSDHDRLAVVAFDSVANVAFRLSEMNETGKLASIAAVEALEPRNSTNIWAGLEVGLDSLRNASSQQQSEQHKRRRFLLFLTDGQPTDSPPQGEAALVRKYFEVHPDFRCMVSTFGFGYMLKSELLLDIAREAGGTFAFIPDALVLGTCFVDAVANARSCLCLDAKVHLEAKNGARFGTEKPIVDHSLPWSTVPWGLVARIGPIHCGQSRDLALVIQIPEGSGSDDYLEVTLEYTADKVIKIASKGCDHEPTSDAVVADARSAAVDALADVISQCDSGAGDKGNQTLSVVVGKLTVLEASTKDPRLTALLADVSGRARKAISTVERFNRWGSHYLRALYRSHQYQLQTNFCDPGLKVYGGTQFRALVEAGGQVFRTLQMKKYSDGQHHRGGSHQQPAAQQSASSAAATPTPPPNATYYASDSSGVCFGGRSVVLTGEMKTKQVSEVGKGDRLLMADGSFSQVAVVVEMPNVSKKLPTLLEPSGLLITPGHPIRLGGDGGGGWMKPRDLAGGKAEAASRVFNFLFEQRPTCGLLVNGIECATWFHAIPELQHDIFSTIAIVEAVRQLPGFETGHARGTPLLQQSQRSCPSICFA